MVPGRPRRTYTAAPGRQHTQALPRGAAAS